MVVPPEQFCGHHGLPNRAIRARSPHHERSILWNADSARRRAIPAQLSIRYAEMITRTSLDRQPPVDPRTCAGDG
jgi:hypothetical protein